MISARMFAEYVASRKNKVAMVSVYLEKFDEMQAQSFFMKLLEKVMQVRKQKAADSHINFIENCKLVA